MAVLAWDDTDKPEEDNQPVLVTQAELNDLTVDLNLSNAHLLGSRFKEKHLSSPGTTFCWHRDSERERIKTVFYVTG